MISSTLQNVVISLLLLLAVIMAPPPAKKKCNNYFCFCTLRCHCLQQVAVVLQTGHAMLCICLLLVSTVQYHEHSLTSLVTSASDSPMHTVKFCLSSLVYSRRPINIDVQACCRKQDSLMLALRPPSV